MKKEEIADIAIHLYNNVDQAGYDRQIEELIKAAPVSALKKFIDELLLDEGRSEWDADISIVAKAKRLCGRFND